MKIKKKLLDSLVNNADKVLEILREYQESGLTPAECKELAEAKQARRLVILPDLTEFARIAAEAVRNNTYGGAGHD